MALPLEQSLPRSRINVIADVEAGLFYCIILVLLKVDLGALNADFFSGAV